MWRSRARSRNRRSPLPRLTQTHAARLLPAAFHRAIQPPHQQLSLPQSLPCQPRPSFHLHRLRSVHFQGDQLRHAMGPRADFAAHQIAFRLGQTRAQQRSRRPHSQESTNGADPWRVEQATCRDRALARELRAAQMRRSNHSLSRSWTAASSTAAHRPASCSIGSPRDAGPTAAQPHRRQPRSGRTRRVDGPSAQGVRDEPRAILGVRASHVALGSTPPRR